MKRAVSQSYKIGSSLELHMALSWDMFHIHRSTIALSRVYRPSLEKATFACEDLIVLSSSINNLYKK